MEMNKDRHKNLITAVGLTAAILLALSMYSLLFTVAAIHAYIKWAFEWKFVDTEGGIWMFSFIIFGMFAFVVDVHFYINGTHAQAYILSCFGL